MIWRNELRRLNNPFMTLVVPDSAKRLSQADSLLYFFFHRAFIKRLYPQKVL